MNNEYAKSVMKDAMGIKSSGALGNPPWDSTPKGQTNMPTILEEAAGLVDGPRQSYYGHPADDFTRTGQLWGALLGTDPIKPSMVGLMMVALKLSREMNRPKRDNLVDAAGYLRTVELVYERESNE